MSNKELIRLIDAYLTKEEYDVLQELLYPIGTTPEELYKHRGGVRDIKIDKKGHVVYLDLSFHNLETLPPAIAKLSKLKVLKIPYGRLKELPSEIGLLSELRSLDLYENQLTYLPEAICNLTSLRSLNIANNYITSLPTCMIDLPNLKQLFLNSPPYQPYLIHLGIDSTKYMKICLSYNNLDETSRKLVKELKKKGVRVF